MVLTTPDEDYGDMVIGERQESNDEEVLRKYLHTLLN